MPRGNGGIIGPANIPTQSSAKGVWSLSELTLAVRQSIWPLENLSSDPYFEYTTLLLPGNGTNGAQNNTFLDGSTNNFTITRNGNTTQGTFSPFSQTGWGNYFDGTGDYLSIADNAVLRLGTSAFTIECWIYRSASGAAHSIAAKGGATTGWLLEVTSGNLLQFTHGTTTIASTGTVSANTWVHVAAVREGTGSNQFKLYINGTNDGTGTVSTDFTQTETLYVAANRSAGTTMNGYVSNFRLTNGAALYTATFTPATSELTTTSQGASSSQVELLTCQSNRFIDNSTNNFTITRNGDTRVVAFSPFNPTASWSAATNGGSGYFDGSADYLSVAYNSNLQLGSSDFTIEFWFYGTVAQNNADVFISGYTSGTNLNYLISVPAGNDLKFYASTTGNSFSAINALTIGTLTTGEWNHIAVTRSGSTVTTYLNGTVGGTSTGLGSSAIYANTAPVYIAAAGDNLTGFNPTGYFSGFRIVKGTAITPPSGGPTSPPTAVTNTQLLLNFTNAGIYDATSKNDLETVGNAQISTTQSKFPPSSMLFDGTGDYLVGKMLPYLAFGSGDMTIECWVYPNTISGQDTIFDTRVSGAYGNDAFTFQLASGVLQLFAGSYASGGTAVIAGSSSVSTGVWTHLAISRASGTNRLFVNGSLITSNSNSWNQTFTSTNLYYVGQTIGVDRPFDGYIQDLRITTGYARYTTTFTPPTAAFPTL